MELKANISCLAEFTPHPKIVVLKAIIGAGQVQV